MILSELIPFLEELGAAPKKSLSQNFLIDPNVGKKILHTAGIVPGDVVLEIGPGPGALTSLLLQAGATVYAIEKDRIFANALARLQTPDQRLIIYSGDALEIPFETIPFQKVVANLPYHITTPLLEKCFQNPFTSLTLMIQKEVAARLFAKSGTKEFGSLTLFAQFYANLDSHFTVSNNCFYPKPSVDSSVIHLTKRKEPPPLTQEQFFPLMRRSFQQRRKMLSTSLQEFSSALQIKQALKTSHLREDARPEQLSFDQWVEFIKNLLPCIVLKNEPSCPNLHPPSL